MDLGGKVVLITGASSGIGAACAERFARAGADVALLARSRPGLEVVAARVRREGARALVVPADVTDRRALAEAFAIVEERLGGPDVVVSNAAAMVFGRFEQIPPEDFDRTLEVTFTGAVNVIREALPVLARRNGTIVVVGSINTKIPLATFSSYAAAKHALRGFLHSLRVELRAAGEPVTVSLVNPGPIDTPLWEHLTAPTGRLPRRPPASYSPHEVAKAVVGCARHPRAEMTVGGMSRAIELAWLVARPLGERILGLGYRLYSGGTDPAPAPGMLWEPSGDGRVSDGMHGRPSLLAPLRLAVDAPRRVLSRR